MNRKIEISERSILFIIFVPLILAFVWLVHDILFSLLIAFILMSAFKPLALFLIKKGMPRAPAIFIVFFSVIIAIVGMGFLIIPPIVNETTTFVKNFPGIVQSLNPELRQVIDFNSLSQYLPNVTNNVFQLIGSVFSNIFFVLTTLFFSLYFLLEQNVFRRVLGPYMPKERIAYLEAVSLKVEHRLTAWFWGQITLMTVIGVAVFIGLSIFGVKYAVPLALLAGLLEVVPNIGPIISTIPATIIGLSQSYVTGFSVLALYFVIQQAENAFIVPLIMRKAVGVNPILTLLSLLIGGRVGGVLGVLLAIPFLIIIETIVGEIINSYYHKPRAKAAKIREHE